jgi:hypothetical protein
MDGLWSLGIDYDDTTISTETKPGIENPIYYWLPSIAPSGMTFVTSDKSRVERTFTSRFIKISVSRIG